tara:strand:+ start:296 stop:664 length:369 start_codon:yes stop_codon:yes gene_type:complete
MKQILIKILLAVTLLLVGCAADTHSSLAEEMLNNMESLIEVLESVTDSSSSKKAMLEIEKINKIGTDIQDRMVQLGEPSEDILRELDEKYRVRGEEAATRLRQVLGGLIESEFGLDIMEALN